MTDKQQAEPYERVIKRMKDAEPYREVWSDEFKVIEALLEKHAEITYHLDRLQRVSLNSYVSPEVVQDCVAHIRAALAARTTPHQRYYRR